MKSKISLTVERRNDKWVIYDSEDRRFPSIEVDEVTVYCLYKDSQRFTGVILAVQGVDFEVFKSLSREQRSSLGLSGPQNLNLSEKKSKYGVLHLHRDGSTSK